MATLESLGTLERRLTFSVPLEEINPEIDQRLRKLARTVKMPGFRNGKVPLKMVQQSYGSQVQAEVVGDVVSKKLGDALTEHKLRVAGEPQIERSTEGVAESELGFAATFEVFPEVVLGDASSLEVDRVTCDIGDADIDRTIEVLRKQRATWHDATGPAKDGDRVTLDFTGTLDGEKFEGGSATDFPFVLGEGRMLPDFETGVRDVAAGTTKTITVNFPADYNAANLAGKAAQFELVVKKVESPKLPELDAELAKTLGVADGDLDKMRADVKSNLEREVRGRVRARTKGSVMDALPKMATLDVPKTLVTAESQRMADEARKELESRGVNIKDLPIPTDAFTERAERRVRLGLIVGEIVKANSLTAKPDQIRAQIEELAQSYENPGEVIRWYFSDRERLGQVESLVVEQNVVDWVLGKAKVTDKPLSFESLMAAAQQGE